MIFETIGQGAPDTLFARWRDALAPVRIRHFDPLASVRVVLDASPACAPTLRLHVDNVLDTRTADVRFRSLVVSNVRLHFFPGGMIARAWLAAAWAGYIAHEALEMVTLGDNLEDRPLDPHLPFPNPFHHGPVVAIKHAPRFPHDRGVRATLPPELTYPAMVEAFATIMPREAALELMTTQAGIP